MLPRPTSPTAAALRRPAAPRGHGGASSLLRVSIGGSRPAAGQASPQPRVLGRPQAARQMVLFGSSGGFGA